MLPDFNRLRVFYQIYRNQSVVAAARVLHLSQPAVSQQLQKLEGELKVELFTRLHKKLIPTAAGHQLFELVQPFVDSLQATVTQIQRPTQHPAGHLRVGAPEEFGKAFLPQLCASFRQTHPEVTFSIKTEETGRLLDMFLEGKLDLALVDIFKSKNPLGVRSDVFSIEPFIHEEIVLACSADFYTQQIDGNHSFRHLVGQRFISDEEDHALLYHWFQHHFRRAAPELEIVMNIDSHMGLIHGLRLGMGLGMVSAHLVWDDIHEGRLRAVRTDRPNIINHISLIQLQDKIPTLTEKTFIAFLKQEIPQSEVTRRFEKNLDE